MSVATANGIQLEYEISGPDDGPVVLLIMGLAAQLIWWPQGFIDELTAAGYRTIRFDNRDVGKSHKFDDKRAPNLMVQALASRFKLRGLAPYSLTDMARDSVSLLDALGVSQAHIIGVSMGGMIGQIVAAQYRDRVKSFSAIMSSTNNPGLPRPKPEVMKALLAPAPANAGKEEALERLMHLWGLIGTKQSGSSEDELRARLTASYERCNYPAGARRQIAAIIETGDLRKRYTRKITAPSLIIHGADDPLAPLPSGIDISKNIKGAQLEVIEGMAHDLPKKFLPKIMRFIIEHMEHAEKDALKRQAA